jgi:hypothetical protein
VSSQLLRLQRELAVQQRGRSGVVPDSRRYPEVRDLDTNGTCAMEQAT